MSVYLILFNLNKRILYSAGKGLPLNYINSSDTLIRRIGSNIFYLRICIQSVKPLDIFRISKLFTYFIRSNRKILDLNFCLFILVLEVSLRAS